MLTKKTLKERVTIDERGCWIFNGATFSDGYGGVYFQGRTQRAHRVSYQLFRGPIPKGILVCHTCDVRRCLNPDHLFLGTHKDNSQDCLKKGRRADVGAQGEGHGHSKLTENQVKDIREKISSGELTQYRAARIYGVDSSLIHGIVHRKYWRHI